MCQGLRLEELERNNFARIVYLTMRATGSLSVHIVPRSVPSSVGGTDKATSCAHQGLVALKRAELDLVSMKVRVSRHISPEGDW